MWPYGSLFRFSLQFPGIYFSAACVTGTENLQLPREPYKAMEVSEKDRVDLYWMDGCLYVASTPTVVSNWLVGQNSRKRFYCRFSFCRVLFPSLVSARLDLCASPSVSVTVVCFRTAFTGRDPFVVGGGMPAVFV